ncbi:MAG: hypothetical protein JXX14_08120 [Deltaproteobacteria bacterium]|nr:hypothetical protein [Deltaproteobacteria bacterium]
MSQLLSPLLTDESANDSWVEKMDSLFHRFESETGQDFELFFFPYREYPDMACMPLQFPSDRISHWRSIWKTEDSSVAVIGTLPTALVEESRTKACVGQLAVKMEAASNAISGRTSRRAFKLYADTWHQSVSQFVDCVSMKANVFPEDGTSRQEFKYDVSCAATIDESVFTGRHTVENNTLETVAPRVDLTRHMLRQEIGYSAFYDMIGNIFQLVSRGEKKGNRRDIVTALNHFWRQLAHVFSVPLQCQYKGNLSRIKLQLNPGKVLQQCREIFPLETVETSVANFGFSLNKEKQNICRPGIVREISTIQKQLGSNDPTQVLRAIDRLGSLAHCVQNCKQNVLYEYVNIPASRLPEITVELKPGR